jgi:hypothetical protein
MARADRSTGPRTRSDDGEGDDDADRFSRSAVRAGAWAGAGGLALSAALAIVAIGGGDPEGPWSLAVTLLAVAGTTFMAVALHITVEAADAAGAAESPGTISTPEPPAAGPDAIEHPGA